jgi:hypothetical protein
VVGVAVQRLALSNISRNLDFLQPLAMLQPLLLHLTIHQDGQLVPAILTVTKQLDL